MTIRLLLLHFGWFILMITVVGQASGQAPRSLDSLLRFLQTAPRDSLYLRAQNDATIQLTYRTADYYRADSVARQQEFLAQKLNNASGLYEAYRNRASVSLFKADYAAALPLFQKALSVAEARNLPRKVIYGAMGNVVTGYDKLGQNEQVIQAALRAIRYQEQYDVRPRQAIPHRLIGSALVKLNRATEAISYYQKAGEIFRENGDPRGIGIFEYQLGDFYLNLKQPKQALSHYRESLKIGQDIKFELLQFDALNGLANANRALNRPAEGFALARRALAIADKQQNALGRATALGTLGLLYKTQKDDKQAETYLKQALTLAEKENNKEDARKYSQALADIYAGQQEYKLAFQFQSQKNRLIDSALTANTNTEVQRLLVRYKTEKKETQIKLLQQEALVREKEAARIRLLNNALLVGGLMGLLLVGAVGAWLLNRAKLRRLEEAQALRKRIAQDLHDEVGSTLSSISLLSGHANKLIAEKRSGVDTSGGDTSGGDTSETTQRLVQKIYTDARQILENIDEIIWTINPGNDSLQRIALRLQEYAQPLMESKDIRFRFHIDPSLDGFPVSMETRRNVYLIGKEAINNLVKYAQATEATLRFERQHRQLRVVIADNGQGFTSDSESSRNGQQNMQQRAEAVGGTLSVQSAPGEGTRLELLLSGSIG